ncbi:MAG: hypothetical protein K2W96_00410 [Gemmataceae bacterium]|nr:hypothetical protein [Gemmataceae bacterium]
MLKPPVLDEYRSPSPRGAVVARLSWFAKDKTHAQKPWAALGTNAAIERKKGAVTLASHVLEVP